MSILCDCEIPGSDDLYSRTIGISTSISGEAHEIIRSQMPDLVEFFPFGKAFHFHAHLDPSGWFGLRLVWPPRAPIIVGPKMEEKDIAFLKEKIEPYQERDYHTVKSILGPEWYADNRFTYIGPYDQNKVSWLNISEHLVEWMNDIPLPLVLERNKARVLRAIPLPPSYNTSQIEKSLWILECEETNQQGTAFALNNVGLVTCSHVIGNVTHAFRHNNPAQKFPVTVIAQHDIIDLAVLSISGPTPALTRGDPTNINQMDHVLVAGHPNYRLGDSPFFIPGLIVGFRPVSGIRRLLTNAAIVRGNSGGPILNGDGQVIGVAVTGADNFRTQTQTEDHAIVPIDALGLIGL